MSKKFMITGMTCLVFCAVILFGGWHGSQAGAEQQKSYVGDDACKDCHEIEYKSFETYAKKRHSYESIKKMQNSLTETEFKQCFECHTTGYGKPGGFCSVQETPHLKNAGCETCHGPGSLHIESEDTEDIKGDLTAKDCTGCHNSERVAEFDFKPLVYGGAH